MDPFVVIIVSCLILGSVVGILAGMLGIGGGLIIVPALSYLLVHFMGMTTETVMPVAIATSLSTIIFTGTSSALAHYKLGNIQRYIVLYTGLGIAFGAIAGAQVASHMSGELLKDVFAVLVILIALQMIFGKQKASDNEASKGTLAAVGGTAGILSALMGIGGGADEGRALAVAGEPHRFTCSGFVEGGCSGHGTARMFDDIESGFDYAQS